MTRSAPLSHRLAAIALCAGALWLWPAAPVRAACAPDVICDPTPLPAARAQSGSVNLQLRDAAGRPLRDADVTIAGHHATSDYSGVASVYDVPVGPQTARINHRGQITQTTVAVAPGAPQLTTVVAGTQSFTRLGWAGGAAAVVIIITLVLLLGRIRPLLAVRPGLRRLRLVTGFALITFIVVFTALVSVLV